MGGEGNFSFTAAMDHLGYPIFASTTLGGFNASNTLKEVPLKLLDDKIWLHGVNATRTHTDDTIKKFVKKGIIKNIAWNFPYKENPTNKLNEEEEDFVEVSTKHNDELRDDETNES